MEKLWLKEIVGRIVAPLNVALSTPIRLLDPTHLPEYLLLNTPIVDSERHEDLFAVEEFLVIEDGSKRFNTPRHKIDHLLLASNGGVKIPKKFRE